MISPEGCGEEEREGCPPANGIWHDGADGGRGEIVIRYSQKVPILVREAIAHTTRKFVRDRQDSRASEEKVSPPVAEATDAE